jgi:hypothetical protein
MQLILPFQASDCFNLTMESVHLNIPQTSKTEHYTNQYPLSTLHSHTIPVNLQPPFPKCPGSSTISTALRLKIKTLPHIPPCFSSLPSTNATSYRVSSADLCCPLWLQPSVLPAWTTETTSHLLFFLLFTSSSHSLKRIQNAIQIAIILLLNIPHLQQNEAQNP